MTRPILVMAALCTQMCAASVMFCNKTEVTRVVNSTSVCVAADEAPLNETVPKCCPLNHTYEPQTKSCKFDESKEPFRGYSYFRVGLRGCSPGAVEDHSWTDAEMRGRNAVVGGRVFEEGEYCVDELYRAEGMVVRVCERDARVCLGEKRCLKKCCPDLEVYVNGAKCQPSADFVFNYTGWSAKLKVVEGDFVVVHGGLSCKKYIAKDNIIFNVDERGNLNLWQLNSWRRYKPNEEMYCVEHVEHRRQSLAGDKLLLCVNPPLQKYNYTRIAMIISCIFILLTIASYVWLLENCNLFSKILMSYCTSLFLTYALLTYVQFHEVGGGTVCAVLAYAATAVLISTFVWMNVLCIDIWSTFGSDSALMTVQEKWEERKRFVWYSLYGWLTPVVIVSFIFFGKQFDFLPLSLQPKLGDAKCLLYSVAGNYSKLAFFLVPITILKICDVILFVKTTIHCMEVKNAINNMKDQDRKKMFIADKERLVLLVKLFVIMGVTWLFEVLSSIIPFDRYPILSSIEDIWDILNCLQGVFIFVVFVCKRQVLDTFLKKTRLRKRRRSLCSGITQSSVLLTKNSTH